MEDVNFLGNGSVEDLALDATHIDTLLDEHVATVTPTGSPLKFK